MFKQYLKKHKQKRSLLKIIYQNHPKLLSEVTQLLNEGADPNFITSYKESPLRIASNNGRFDVVKLLLSNGADESQLKWTPLFHAIAYGDLSNMEELITSGCNLEALDYWKRTPLLLSILVGNIDKTALLIDAKANIQATGHCNKPPLFYATVKDDDVMLRWLLEQGFDPEQTDDFENTTLIQAAEYGAKGCVQTLVDEGVDIFKENHISEQAITTTENLDVVTILVKAGADLNKLCKETRALLLGYKVDQAPNVLEQEYHAGKHRTFGNSNPELSNNPFWYAMVKCGGSAYHASQEFDKKRDIFEDQPIWCYERYGKSITQIEDGQFIEIAGEHEDHYDPDFCIYNDVFVHDGKGGCKIYTYPKEVFPQTDFHSATLVDNFIYIIGNVGYPEERKYGFTPVYKLDLKTLTIEKIDTLGDMPGWISSHSAYLNSDNTITVQKGKVLILSSDKEDFIENSTTYTLCLNSMIWQKNDSKTNQ